MFARLKQFFTIRILAKATLTFSVVVFLVVIAFSAPMIDISQQHIAPQNNTAHGQYPFIPLLSIASEFGGLSFFTLPCICSLSVLIGIIPPPPNPVIGGLFSFHPFLSTAFLYFQLFSAGVFYVGSAAPPYTGYCWFFVWFPPACVPINAGERFILDTGTSLT